MAEAPPLSVLLNDEGMKNKPKDGDFDWEESARLTVHCFLMCVHMKNQKGTLQHSGGLIALGIELEHVKLTPDELNWVVGALMV